MRDYDLITKIGEGGMATVWKAWDRTRRAYIAIKVLKHGLRTDPRDIRALKAEEQLMEEVNHPGVVHAWRFDSDGDSWYMAMELVEGYTFADFIKRKRKVKEADALLIAESVGTALGYVWENHGLVHCDIKPENIMISKEGVVKLADLGIAYRFRNVEGGALEKPDHVTGTPAYISPEQVYGDVELDCRADIYSLGATLYRLVTGKFLFPAIDEVEPLLRAHCDPNEQSPDPRVYTPELSEGFVQLLEAMLVKDREGRVGDWPTVVALCAEIEQGRAFKPRQSDYISSIRLMNT